MSLVCWFWGCCFLLLLLLLLWFGGGGGGGGGGFLLLLFSAQVTVSSFRFISFPRQPKPMSIYLFLIVLL